MSSYDELYWWLDLQRQTCGEVLLPWWLFALPTRGRRSMLLSIRRNRPHVIPGRIMRVHQPASDIATVFIALLWVASIPLSNVYETETSAIRSDGTYSILDFNI